MSKVSRKLIALVCPVVFSAALAVPTQAGTLFPPPGEPQPTMKRLDQVSTSRCIDQLPFVITQPGTYTVCGNLSFVDGEAGITISAPNVTLDFNGASLRGSGPAHGVAVLPGVRDVTIRNGRLNNWGGDGIHAPDARNVTIDSMQIDTCGGHGALLGGQAGGSISSSSFRGNTGDGVRYVCSSGGDCDDTDPQVYPGLSSVSSTGNGGSGIHSDGISLVLRHCVTSDNALHGVRVEEGNSPVPVALIMERCESSRNGGNGVSSIDVPFDMDSCVTRQNTSHGVHQLNTEVVSSGTRAKNYNSTRSNRRKNSVGDGNGGDGIRIEMDGLVDVDHLLIGNNDNNNDGNGISVLPASEGSSGVSVLIEKSDVRRNAGHGIHLVNCPHDLRDVTMSLNDGHGGYMEFGSISGESNGRSSTRAKSYNSSRSNKSAGVSSSGNGGAGLVVLVLDDAEVDYTISSSSLSNNGAHGVCFEDKVKGSSLACPGGDCPSTGRASLTINNSSSIGNAMSGLMMETSNTNSSPSFWCGNTDHFISDNNGDDGITVEGAVRMTLHSSSLSGNARHGLHHVHDPDDDGDGLPDLTWSAVGTHFNDNGANGLSLENALNSVSLDRCEASSNGARGISVCADCDGDSFPDFVSLDSCIVLANAAEGVFVGNSSEIKMDRCSVSSNGGVGAHLFSSLCVVTESSLSRNDGGGLYCWGSGRVANNTVANNNGNGVTLEGDGFIVTNNLVRGHVGPGADRLALNVSAPGSVIGDNLFLNNDQATNLLQDNDPLYEPTGQVRTNPLYNSP